MESTGITASILYEYSRALYLLEDVQNLFEEAMNTGASPAVVGGLNDLLEKCKADFLVAEKSMRDAILKAR